MQLRRAALPAKGRSVQLCGRPCQIAEHLRDGCPAVIKAAQEAKWSSVKDVCARLNPVKAHVITLNVGGRLLMCSQQTLCSKYPLSLLGLLFSGDNRPLEKLDDGSVFIDRNGDTFGLLLDWLRGCGAPLDRLSQETREQLCNEATFWQLEELAALLQPRPPVVVVPAQSPPKKKVITMEQVAVMLKISDTLRLVDADLSGPYLAGVKLGRARFIRCDFTAANLSGAILTEANFTASDLSKADLSGAQLSSVTFTSSQLSGADLSGVQLSSATLTSSDLSGVDLSLAQVHSANLTGCKLNRTRFFNANLSVVTFANCDFHRPDFTEAFLRGVEFVGKYADDALWKAAAIEKVTIADTNSSISIDLSEANLAGELLFRNATLSRIIPPPKQRECTGSTRVTVDSCRAIPSVMLGLLSLATTSFQNVSFSSLDLRGRDLRALSFQKCDFSATLIDSKTLFPGDLRGCNLSRLVMTPSNFPAEPTMCDAKPRRPPCSEYHSGTVKVACMVRTQKVPSFASNTLASENG